MLMPLEALLVVLEPHLCPASPSASPAPLPEELPIHVLFVRDDGGPSSTWQTWGPRQWTLLFSLWINCPPFKTLFLNHLREAELALALLRMGLPGNMFERGAALQSDLQQRLVQWGRLSSGGSSSDLGPPGANDPSPKSPTAFKRDVRQDLLHR
ncbi:hypothetical protein HaLaN_25450, partial [Haematococcus lacustris]